jgi:hypothetical protein
MQLLFSFDRSMRAEKNLMQTLASQLSSTLILIDQGYIYRGERGSLRQLYATEAPVEAVNLG